MTYQDFVALVQEMRILQANWFKEPHNVRNLFKAQQLEKRVDDAIAEYHTGPDLFAKEQPNASEEKD